MTIFKNISYTNIIFEALRSGFSVNAKQKLSILYRYCLALLYPLQLRFDDFSVWRDKERVISQCKWEIGQLTNVLNYLYDSTLKRIYLTEVAFSVVFLPTFDDAYTPVFLPTFDDAYTPVFLPTFDDNTFRFKVQIHVPAPYYTVSTPEYTDLVATIEKIKLSGIKYEIVSI